MNVCTQYKFIKSTDFTDWNTAVQNIRVRATNILYLDTGYVVCALSILCSGWDLDRYIYPVYSVSNIGK